MKTILSFGLTAALCVCATATAQEYAPESTNFFAIKKSAIPTVLTESTNFLVNLPIPDNSPSGIASTMDVTSSIDRIGDLNVSLRVSGGFNGDLYGYLSHDSGFSVLLNRVGRTSTDQLGYGDAGFDVLFDDSAVNGDIHTYRLKLSGNTTFIPVTGTWAPDARTADPATVTSGDPRTAFLNSFYTADPSGKWTLFLADLSPGGSSTLVSWGLEITQIPEPSQVALLLAGGFMLLFATQRWRKS